jgi:hypothetical protein
MSIEELILLCEEYERQVNAAGIWAFGYHFGVEE